MPKMYALWVDSGQYDDHRTSVVGIYDSHPLAQEALNSLVAKLNKERERYSYDKQEELKAELADKWHWDTDGPECPTRIKKFHKWLQKWGHNDWNPGDFYIESFTLNKLENPFK